MQERTQIMVPLFTADVRFTDQLGVQAAVSVPDVTRSAVVSRPGSSVNFSETFSGLGDMSVVGWYRLRPIRRWYVVTTLGASLPTGKTEAPRFREELSGGSLVPVSRLQRGSGTVDPLLGASLTRKFTAGTVFGSIAARTPLYDNGDGLRTGRSSEINTGIAREFFTTRFSAFARVGWLHRGPGSFSRHARPGWRRRLDPFLAWCRRAGRQRHPGPGGGQAADLSLPREQAVGLRRDFPVRHQPIVLDAT